jgi:glycosyltransferase involved in cell wall biosynthesis
MEGSVVILRAGWLPTRQANGLQTISMGHAFSKLGFKTTLFYIPSPYVKNDPLRFCDSKPQVILKPLPRAVFPIKKSFKLDHWRSLPCFVHAFVWSGLVSHVAARSKVDLFFVREPMIAWWLGRRGLPTILEMHDMPTGGEQIFIRWASQQSSVRLILAVTNHLRADLTRQKLVPPEKLLTLHDGIDLSLTSPLTNKEKARHKLGLPLCKRIVVYTGQLETEKGVEILVRAAPMLGDVDIILVGIGPLADGRLQRVIQEANASNIKLMGLKPHSDALLFQNAADVLVLPHSMKFLHSAYYTSPLKLFEYMAAAAPIVASDLPATREVLRHGENGWLIQPDNPVALAEGIRHLLEHQQLASGLARQASRDVEAYTWENRAARILDRVGLTPVQPTKMRPRAANMQSMV